jgi:hypothetical protein
MKALKYLRVVEVEVIRYNQLLMKQFDDQRALL